MFSKARSILLRWPRGAVNGVRRTLRTHTQGTALASGGQMNSLILRISAYDFKRAIFRLCFTDWYDNALSWVLQYLTDQKSTLVEVMAWHHQASSHYLNQCGRRSLMWYGIIRPQWVNTCGTEFVWENKDICLDLKKKLFIFYFFKMIWWKKIHPV